MVMVHRRACSGRLLSIVQEDRTAREAWVLVYWLAIIRYHPHSRLAALPTRVPTGLDPELFCDSELVCAEFLITDLARITCLGYEMRRKYLNVSALTLDF